MNPSQFSFAPKVLLVDDEVQQLQLRAKVMELCGFSVIAANGPNAAISELEAGTVAKTDVAVLDYNMPEMNGSALARRLRSTCPRLKIILHSGALDIPQSDMTSVDAYVPKSDGIASLITKIVQFVQANRTNPFHAACKPA